MYFQEVIDLIKSHPILTIATITVTSELLWKTFLYIREKTTPERNVHEVLMFNEKGGICLTHHMETEFNRNIADQECTNPFCSKKNVNRIVNEIDQAKYSIDLAMYTITSTTLANALIRSLERGVNIRVISDSAMINSAGSKIRDLVSAGVTWRIPDSTSMMHHKFCVIDGEARVKGIFNQNKRKTVRPYCSLLISGSVNWTNNGFEGNWENCIITTNKEWTNSFQAEFDRIWKARFSNTEVLRTQY